VHPTARSLRTRRSGLVGVLVPDLTNPVLPPIVRGIEETLWQAGLACLLADTDNDLDREASAVAELQARRCEGLIVATATRDSATVHELSRAGVATVLVTREVEGVDLPFVAGDDAAGVRAAARHLRALGHERIGYIAGPSTLSTTATRLAVVREELPGGVVRDAAAYGIAEGRDAAGALLDAGVTAILAGNDMLAVGAYEALAARGLRCPDDVSVAGHNDMPLVDKLAPPLTTVAIPQYEIGVEAAGMLLTRLAGAELPARRRLLPTTLIVRGSTAPPPHSSRRHPAGHSKSLRT
jgi:LacI family transcriptional regulator